jgi:hypothetical protein
MKTQKNQISEKSGTNTQPNLKNWLDCNEASKQCLSSLLWLDKNIDCLPSQMEN